MDKEIGVDGGNITGEGPVGSGCVALLGSGRKGQCTRSQSVAEDECPRGQEADSGEELKEL